MWGVLIERLDGWREWVECQFTMYFEVNTMINKQIELLLTKVLMVGYYRCLDYVILNSQVNSSVRYTNH